MLKGREAKKNLNKFILIYARSELNINISNLFYALQNVNVGCQFKIKTAINKCICTCTATLVISNQHDIGDAYRYTTRSQPIKLVYTHTSYTLFVCENDGYYQG